MAVGENLCSGELHDLRCSANVIGGAQMESFMICAAQKLLLGVLKSGRVEGLWHV